MNNPTILNSSNPNTPWIAVCSCSAHHPISPRQAGEHVVCRCGSKLEIPSLGKLRLISGKGQYEAGTIDTINYMIQSGVLPLGQLCVVSGRKTSDTFVVYYQCEYATVKFESPRDSVFSFFGFLIAIAAPMLFLSLYLFGDSRKNQAEPTEVGYNRGVGLPLRVDREFHADLRKEGRRQELIQYLNRVPVYQKLFSEYPNGSFHFYPVLGS
jgi:hypothetical protein